MACGMWHVQESDDAASEGRSGKRRPQDQQVSCVMLCKALREEHAGQSMVCIIPCRSCLLLDQAAGLAHLMEERMGCMGY